MKSRLIIIQLSIFRHYILPISDSDDDYHGDSEENVEKGMKERKVKRKKVVAKKGYKKTAVPPKKVSGKNRARGKK